MEEEFSFSQQNQPTDPLQTRKIVRVRDVSTKLNFTLQVVSSKSYAQTTLNNWFSDQDLNEPKIVPKKRSKPDEVKSSPILPQDQSTAKKRGRKRLWDKIKKQIKTESGKTVEILADLPAEEEKQPKSKLKSGPYKKLTYQNKKNILDDFAGFKSTIKISDGKPYSFNDFCRDSATKYDSKLSTIKRLVLDYLQTPSIYLQLEILCSNKKRPMNMDKF